ncbi:dUMP phosphatase [Pseudoalteromonas sp. CO325X]|uniref:pyrimidine 5'-nucleotidase n=1 Tax=Pseudoalteromonas sp. CO325X TaxID=1777262 RepID=UPI001023EC79|nr:pyrimidine 5'-nucleotidase [Pseudoalteromonas sp. CO325X]RZF79132.1 dUMP phosphatase [Pseudoalteromonas sp. CO325X]
MRYPWILFDADETLFHFDAKAGLTHMFARYEVDFADADYRTFEAVNRPLWVAYQDNTITAQQLQERRFEQWSERLGVSARELNLRFMEAMAEICQPLPGAIELLNALQGKAKLGIITNGFTELQSARLEKTGLKGAFEWLVISEQVGYAKPHMAVFDHAFALMGHPPKEQILMVGDTLESDIVGGINAGIDTCWLNRHEKQAPAHMTPTYEVKSLCQLRTLLL